MEISGTDPDVDVEKKDANIFIVKSFNQDNTKYVVDMSLGLCECKAGVNGSVCKHQYVLWANKVAQGTNFLPIFSQQQRMKFAEIAIGASVAPSYYEGLYDRLLETPADNLLNDIPPSLNDQDILVEQQSGNGRRVVPDQVTEEEVINALEEAKLSIQAKINTNDQNFLRCIMKFTNRVK